MPRLVIAISLARFCGYCFSGRIDIIAKPLPVIRRGEEIVLFCDRQPSKPVVRRIARLPVANASAGNFNRNEPGGNYFAEGMADQPPADPGFDKVAPCDLQASIFLAGMPHVLEHDAVENAAALD